MVDTVCPKAAGLVRSQKLCAVCTIKPPIQERWTLPENPVLSVEDTDAFVMLRSPFYLHPEGLLILLEGAFQWRPVPYVEASACDHTYQLCCQCQQEWYWDHNIRLVKRGEPEIYTDFDALARDYRESQGIPEPALDPNPWG